MLASTNIVKILQYGLPHFNHNYTNKIKIYFLFYYRLQKKTWCALTEARATISQSCLLFTNKYWWLQSWQEKPTFVVMMFTYFKMNQRSWEKSFFETTKKWNNFRIVFLNVYIHSCCGFVLLHTTCTTKQYTFSHFLCYALLLYVFLIANFLVM